MADFDQQLDEDGEQQYDDVDQLLFNEHEDQVNKIVASPNQASLFEEDQSEHIGKSLFAPDRRNINQQIEEVKKSHSQIDSVYQHGLQPLLQTRESVAYPTQTNQERFLKISQIKPNKQIGSSGSAFSQWRQAKQMTRDHRSGTASNTNNQQEQESNTIFSISENILMMLNQDYSQEDSTQHKNDKVVKPNDKNKVVKLTKRLLETLQKCNPRYNYLQVMNPRRELTFPSEGVLNDGYDNLDNDYILRVGDTIITPEAKEYEILDLLGKGTFGQVVKCIHKPSKEMVAIKVIKNKKAFKNQGVIEIKIIDILNRVMDPNGESPIVRMLDFFVFRDHLCIVFELLSASLYDLLKENQFQGLSLNFSRLIIRKILEGMKVIKDARLIHCDLKPENILFKTKENLNLKIIDLGSACFEGFAIFQYIQSRYYRSPEVIMGLPYDSSIDMWSLGCICAELFLGIPIFPGNSEYDQLSRIIEILGLPPQQQIQRAKFRDKYFVFQPEIMMFRFKTFEEFQYTNNVRLEIPQKYINIQSLDDLKMRFIQKKRFVQFEQAQREGKLPNPNTFQPVIQESEMNSMDAFIDFLKGVLRIDKDQRWTPSMAMEHPFITREVFNGHFEPQREPERRSTNETGDDTMSERSSSSKDSREYKVGSCPSKLLYPQTASLPQYLQSHQNSIAGIGGGGGHHQHNQSSGGHEFVFHGTNPNVQSHRPPILSIPEEYFKGFMFGRLDQILSMTREQLFQFIYEQNEIAYRMQHAQKMQMIQQQQFMIQQQQMLQQQQIQQQQQQQQFMMQQNPKQFMQMQGQQPQMMGFIPRMNQVDPTQTQQQIPQAQAFYDPNALAGKWYSKLEMPMIFQGSMQQQQPFIGIGGQFITGPQPMMHPQMMPQMMQPQMNQPQFMMPSEQIIFHPPPYQMQKAQLSNMAQITDPQYHEMILQQQKRQAFKNKGFGQSGTNKGKAGSWNPNQGIQQHKYNQYYNQISNPGQIMGGRQNFESQQQFIHANPKSKQKTDKDFTPGSFTKNDFKSLKEKKKHNSRMSGDMIAQSVIIEESEAAEKNQQPPFPQSHMKQGSFIEQNTPKEKQQFFPLFQDPLMNNSQFQKQFQIDPQLQQQQMMGFTQNKPPLGTKQFPSPKFQPQHGFQQMKTHSFQNPQQKQSFTNQPQMKSNSFIGPNDGGLGMNQSFSSGQLQQTPGGKGYLKKVEQQSSKGNLNTQTAQQDRQYIQNHHYQYQKFKAHPGAHGIGSANLNTSVHSYRNRSNSDQVDESFHSAQHDQESHGKGNIFDKHSFSQSLIQQQAPHSAKGQGTFKFDSFSHQTATQAQVQATQMVQPFIPMHTPQEVNQNQSIFSSAQGNLLLLLTPIDPQFSAFDNSPSSFYPQGSITIQPTQHQVRQMNSFKSYNSGSFKNLSPVTENEDGRGQVDDGGDNASFKAVVARKSSDEDGDDDEYGYSLFSNPMQMT